jgi:hypothetical protein
MAQICRKCNQPLDVARPKLKVCSSCGAAVPSPIIIQQLGPALLIKEEADAAQRQKAGKTLTSVQKLILKLKTLEPEGTEFYTVAATHLRKQARPNRTYGVFFIFFGTVGALLPLTQRTGTLHTLLMLFGYLFFGALGLIFFYYSSATLKNLPKTSEGDDANDRLRRLRKVAMHYPQDPIAALILHLTED